MTPSIRTPCLILVALTALAGAAPAQPTSQAGTVETASRSVPAGTGFAPVCTQLELSAGIASSACGRLSLASVARQFLEKGDDEKRK